MKLVCTAAVAAIALSLAGTAFAKDTGGFVLQLGTDTTSVERYTRDGDRLEVDQVGRAPRTLRRKFTFDSKDGVVQRYSVVVTPPGAAQPTQTVEARMDGDSLRTDIKNGANPVIQQSVFMPKGTIIIPISSPWVHWETLTMKLAKTKGDTTGAPYVYMGGTGTSWMTASRAGKDSVTLRNTGGDEYRVRVDKAGHVLGVTPISGTQMFGVTRESAPDVDAYAASFTAREKAAGAMGQLSPRDTVRASTGGANLTLDYSRPTKRGRVVFGNVVQWNQVWRTGANAATQLRTDKDLIVNGTTVPAGFYTIFTLPSPSGWKLMFNIQTGQWGTDHDASKDAFTFDMKVESKSPPVEKFTIAIEPAGDGGVLAMEWDTTRATLPFAVKP